MKFSVYRILYIAGSVSDGLGAHGPSRRGTCFFLEQMIPRTEGNGTRRGLPFMVKASAVGLFFLASCSSSCSILISRSSLSISLVGAIAG